MKGIEPSSVAWEATALPLSYTRVGTLLYEAGPDRASAAVHAGDYRLLVNNWNFACDNPLDYGSEQIACDRGALRRQEMRFRVFVRAAHGWPPAPDTADQREPSDYEFEADPDARCVRSIRVAAHRFVVRFNLQLLSAAPQALRPACKLAD